MLSVLHVVCYYPPDRMGGVGEVVAHLHRGLLRGGYESTVLTAGVSVDDPSIRRIARSPGGFSFAAFRFASLARAADIVHVHHGEGVGLLLAMRMMRIRTPVLLTLHVSVPTMRKSLGSYRIGDRRFHHGGLRSWSHRQVTMRVRAALDRLAIRLADRLSFISRSAATDVLGGDQASEATIIYNGLPASGVETDTPAEPVDLLFVGANSERKRVELLPLILAEVRQQRPDARLRILGFERDENPEFVMLAGEFGLLDAIEFGGRVRSSDLGRHYRSARVLLVPSNYEGLPMVILEAMQNGLPVVATCVSGHPEVIEDGVNGLLVPLDDPSAMASAAVRLLSDASLSERIGSAGPETISKRFSVEQQVRCYLAEYERISAGQFAP